MTAEQLKHAFLQNKFPYIKIELEANVSPSGYQTCYSCDENYDEDDEPSECDYLSDFEHRFRRELGEPAKTFKYLKIYNDGSVDTECTLTLRVDHIAKLPKIIKAFKETCEHFGRCETGNAGMHITVLEGYKYPRKKKLDPVKLGNFKRNVSRLLFGLYYLGTTGETTRGFAYRDSKISETGKHSAIHTNFDTCIEYRLFDPCYREPERIFEYLRVIVKTLKYYTTDPTKVVSAGETLTVEKSNRLLRKKFDGSHTPLAYVFGTRASRVRLFRELEYLLTDKGRKVLQDVKAINPATLSPELFTAIKQF